MSADEREEQERRAFEAWCEADLMPLEANWFDRDGAYDYIDESIQGRWRAWLARANLAAESAKAEIGPFEGEACDESASAPK